MASIKMHAKSVKRSVFITFESIFSENGYQNVAKLLALSLDVALSQYLRFLKE